MTGTVKLNRSLLTRELVATPQNRKVSERIVREAVEEIINEARIDFLVEFDNHPITEEIEAGPSPSVPNTSGTLNGYGNLFSFIGFPHDFKPIQYLRSFFLKKTGITKVRLQSISRGRFLVGVNIPTKEEIYSDPKNNIRWEPGRCWLDGIEKGISGFGQYIMARNQADRIASLTSSPPGSGEAIQLKPTDKIKLRSGKFKPQRYFSEIYNKFLKRFI